MMKKSIIIIIIIGATFGFLIFFFKDNNHSSKTEVSSSLIPQNREAFNKNDNLIPKAEIAVEKIEVIHFHGTHQCWSCIKVGEYAFKTIKEKFPKEYEDEMIIFKDINGELPENRDIVIKYRARGPSLFVNTIINGKDNIEEDVTVWRLVYDESQYISYFENKLNKLLGK